METGITNRRMLERDLTDLNDSRLMNAKYDRKMKNYYLEEPSPAGTIPARRMAHLIRLKRLGTLIVNLSQTDYSDYLNFEEAVKKYENVKRIAKNNPGISKEEIAEAKEDVCFYARFIGQEDLKKEYYELFPESNERTRQRDFEEISRIPNFSLFYSRKLGKYIYYIIGITD